MKNYDCIFLDRDGTINSDPNGYISSLQNFNLYDFTIPALKRLSELGNKFCIITNQSGISRGLIKEENLNFIHDYIYRIFEQHEIKLLKNGASAVILADKDNSSFPIFSGLEKASSFPDSDFKIFGKPTSRPYRRMAVALSYSISESTESLVERAKHIADIISIN